MARIARIVAPNYPHHIIQRGNRRQQVFFKTNDYQVYLDFLEKYAKKFHLKIVSYCLMPNHVHLLVIPETEDSLARGIGETHRNYTRMINFREKWRGYLWQGRFSSYVLDEPYLYNTVKYILLNPVKANIVTAPEDYKWSSIKYHLNKKKSSFLNDSILENIEDWNEFMKQDLKEEEINILKRHERTGRPLGAIEFIEHLEKILGTDLKKKKPGPRLKTKDVN